MGQTCLLLPVEQVVSRKPRTLLTIESSTMRSDAGRVVGALGQSANLDTTSTPSEMSSIILPLEVCQ
jgi:hypothetical protein